MNRPVLPPQRLVLLDGLRGIAAIGVMLYHLEVVFGGGSTFSRCYLFVDFFFLLSGFVLARGGEPQMRARGGAVRFMRGRVRRLWPMIALGVGAGALVAMSIGRPAHVPELVILALLMIPAFGFGPMLFPLNGPQWSLLLELIANAAHALVLHRLSDRQLLAVATIAGALLGATILHFGSNTVGPFTTTFGHALSRVAFPYVLGIWMARHRARIAPRGALSPAMILLLPGAVLVILPGLPLAPAWGDLACVILFFPALLWAATDALPDASADRGLSTAGALSFPLYAIHLPVLQLVSAAGTGPLNRLAALGIALFVAGLLARIAEPRRAPAPRGDRISAPRPGPA